MVEGITEQSSKEGNANGSVLGSHPCGVYKGRGKHKQSSLCEIGTQGTGELAGGCLKYPEGESGSFRSRATCLNYPASWGVESGRVRCLKEERKFM